MLTTELKERICIIRLHTIRSIEGQIDTELLYELRFKKWIRYHATSTGTDYALICVHALVNLYAHILTAGLSWESR